MEGLMIGWYDLFQKLLWRDWQSRQGEPKPPRKGPLTYPDILADNKAQYLIAEMCDAFDDKYIAKHINSTPGSVRRYRLSQGWRKR
jgi:hypothetical protein